MSISDTVEIMGDPELMASLRSGIRDLQEGNVVSIDEVKAELGIIPPAAPASRRALAECAA